MKHYEQRLEHDEQDIRRRTEAVADHVADAVKNSVHALLTGNHKLANLTILGDGQINRETRAIDRECHHFIVRHLPSAGHLRLMSATIRSVIALERVGDYAVTIARVAAQLSSPPADRLAVAVENMATACTEMLERALTAFAEANADQAKAIMVMADQVERLRSGAMQELTTSRDDFPIEDLFSLFSAFSMLERISDQAKNLCEEAVFVATGETKAKKVYRILFLDQEGTRLAPMAAAIARRNFPGSGRYSSASLTPAEALDTDFVAFMAGRGIDIAGVDPRRFDAVGQELAEYHVVASLQGPISDYITDVPFHTVALEWDVAGPDGDAAQDYEALYRNISVEVRNLAEQLRGPEAD